MLQDSYVKVLEGRAVFGGRSSFRTWLFGVIRRTAAEHRRRRLLARLRLVAAPHALAGVVDPSPDGATALVREESARRLVEALATLPRRQEEVLHLVFYQQLTIEEAGEVMGVSVGTARTHYERGKRRLRRLLGAEGER